MMIISESLEKMHITLIFKNQTQVDLVYEFNDTELENLKRYAIARRVYILDDLFIDFGEVIFYTLTEKEDKDG